MNKLLLILFASIIFISCDYTPSLKVFFEDEMVYEVNKIKDKDTTISIKDYFITYKMDKNEMQGVIKNIDGSTTDFKSSTNVIVELYKSGTVKVYSGIN